LSDERLTGFKLRSEIADIETIAVGGAIRDLAHVVKKVGQGPVAKAEGAGAGRVPLGQGDRG
jgi:hypothetical protein